MNDLRSTEVDQEAATKLHRLADWHASIPVAAVLVACLWIGAGAISKSYLIGRLANPITHNDVNYFIDGIRRLLYVETNGFWREVVHLWHEPLHAPLSAYQAAASFYLFGFHDWAPYASNVVYLAIFLAACAALLRGLPKLVIVAGVVAAAGMPLAATTVSEFAPEIPIGLFAALGVLLTLRIRMFDRRIWLRAAAGLCFGLAFLAKPSSLVFIPLAVGATLAMVFCRDVLIAGEMRRLREAIYCGALQVGLSLWLPLLYVVPSYRHYIHYFYSAMFDRQNVKAFNSAKAISEHILYYLTGDGAELMFGNLLWAYVGMIALGTAAALKRGDRHFISRQLELLVLAFLFCLLPTVAEAKNLLFAVPYGYLLALMVVMALGSVYRTIEGRTGIAAASLLGFLLLVSGTSRGIVPNTPRPLYAAQTHVILEKWRDAQDRFRVVMLDNSPDYYGRSVYLTNVGYYHVPTLWYWFLKQDPTLDWIFRSEWQESDPQHHLDFIRGNRLDFVIAGERDNGLTFGRPLIPSARASEDAVLAALWADADYRPIDRFYGPSGRTITVFQRAVAFAGWRPLAGLKHPAAQAWTSDGPITHLQAYAPDAVAARLTIDANGPAGQSVEVSVNKNGVGRLVFDADGKAALARSINLVPGQNDIILRYASDAPVSFERLLVIREIGPNG